jgi:protein tyrosine/serine phosphatase
MPTMTIGSDSLKGDLPNFETVSPQLFRGGQPTGQGIEELKARGVKTIISLRHNKFQVQKERKQAAALGIKFLNIPLDGLHKVHESTIKEFLSVVQDPANQPVFVHCEWGLDRTGALVGIYRQEVQKWSAKDAYDEMISLGFEKKYAWLADSVFDYEEDKLGTLSGDRPNSVKALDSMQEAIGTRPKRKVRQKSVANES